VSIWILGSLYIPLTLIALVMSLILRKSVLRLVVRLLAGALVVPLLIFGGLLVLYWESEPPSLAELQHKFPSRQSDLETILRMSDEDTQFPRIAPDFLWREAKGSMKGGEFMGGDPNAGLVKPRWDQYRNIYRRNGIKLGILRNKERDVFIMVDSIGLLNRGHTTGYLYCSTDTSNDAGRFEPCQLHQDQGERRFNPDKREEAYAFQRLNGRWFAFDQGPS
jgi:hypothetical protein